MIGYLILPFLADDAGVSDGNDAESADDQSTLADKNPKVYAAIGFFLPPLAYFLLGRKKLGFLCLISFFFLGLGVLIVPVHAWKIIGAAKDGTDQSDGGESTDAGDSAPESEDDHPAPSDEPLEPETADYTEEQVIEAEMSDDPIAEWEPPEGDVLEPEERLHRDFIAPTDMEVNAESIRTGDKWAQSIYVNSWPEMVRDGFLNSIFSDAAFDTDISVHLEPRKQETAKAQLQDRIGAIEAQLDERSKQGASAEARDVKKKLDITRQMYDLVSQQGMTLFDASMYINHRGWSEEQVRSQLDDVRGMMERPPASTDVRVATRRQDKCMTSAAPIGMDELGKKNPMLGGSAAAMMPFTSASRIEENGVDFGVQPYNGSPIIVNRFGRDTGYNMMTIGNIGSGKSFSTKLNLVRTLQRRDDVDVVMLDPLEGFIGVNKALGGNRIVVGGNVGLNPMEIRETPAEILEQAGGDLDPYSAKLKDVMTFFETFFAMRGDNLDDERRGVLEKAVQKAYADRGITTDPDTHGKDSPTLLDVMDNLEEMATHPERYTRSESETEKERISGYSSDLLVGMQPFSEGGEFENLTKETEISIGDSRITYLDLQQQEGSGGTGLMMQLLFNTVYERAKQTDKMIFVIDEARYLMKDAANLEFLEQAVRHSRHYNLSIQFVTQTVDEFFAQDEAEAIANNCSLIQLNRVAGLDDETAMNKLGLNRKQAEFVRNALPGDKERGYSECLLGVEGDWYPIHVKASGAEAQVVDFDPDEMDRSDLPGYERIEGTETEQRIEEALEVGVATETPEEHGTDESIADKMETIEAVGFEEGEEFTPEKPVEEMTREELVELIKQGDFGDVGIDRFKKGESDSSESSTAEVTKTSGAWGDDHLDDGGTRVYYVELDIDDSETEADSDEMPVIDSLGDAFTVYATDPSELAIRAGDYGVGFDAVIATSHGEQTFTNALKDLAEVAAVDVADITSQIELADEAEGIDASELERFRRDTEAQEQSGSNEVFNQLKTEVEEYEDHSQIEDDMEGIEFDKIEESTDEVGFDELVEADPGEFTFDDE